MPQLNPAPWLMILVFSWLVFLAVLPPKIAAHAFPSTPVVQTTKSLKTNPWAWPWR